MNYGSAVMRGRPSLGSSASPSSRPRRNRYRHFDTVSQEMPSSANRGNGKSSILPVRENCLAETESRLDVQETTNMNNSAFEESLVSLIQMLSPAKQRQLMEITQALAEPIQADINWAAGLVTAEFADEFASRLQLHHATHSKELQRIAIERYLQSSFPSGWEKCQSADVSNK